LQLSRLFLQVQTNFKYEVALAKASKKIIYSIEIKQLRELICMDGLSGRWNQRLNKSKSHVLTEDNLSFIGRILCATHLKYLGVQILLD
jgi:hypothetical protein